MANLFDIGKSGLESYRQALSVTGQNIANIDTDGYKRREASLDEISGGKAGITSVGKETGLGVRVSSIRRSFDEFLLNKARSANASAVSKETFYQNVKALEDIILPGEANIGTQINRFFSGLQEISTTPSDMAARAVALEQGRALANSFQELSVLSKNMNNDLANLARQQVTDLNIFTSELAILNQQIAAMGSSATNSILDSRDALVDRISNIVGVTVELSSAGAAKLTLGSTGQGPTVVDGVNQNNLSVSIADGRLSFAVAKGASQFLTSQVTSGSLHGVGDAYRTTEEVMAEIDRLAFVMVRDMNAVHKQGIDLDGEPGGLLFRALDVNIQANPTNFGDSIAEAQIIDHGALSAEKIVFTFDAEKQTWNGRSETGNLVASGRSSVTLPGLNLGFFGDPVNLDQIILDPIIGSASGVNFALSRGEDFAAASPILVSSDVTNLGDAVLSMTPNSSQQTSGLSTITDFHNGLSAISATQFVDGGAVAVIPANVSSIDLLSLSRQSSVQFNVAESDMAGVTSMSLVIESNDSNGNLVSKTVDFSLNPSSFKDGGAGWSSMDEIASLLNQGAITGTVSGTAQAVTLASLGAYASGLGENMTISLSADEFTSASMGLGSGRNSQAAVLARIDAASDIQILTREGRHIAGTIAGANSSEKWFSQISDSQPFFEGAEYRSDFLNLSGDDGYIGVNVDGVFSATDALVKTLDNSVLKLSEVNTPTLGDVNLVRLSTLDGKVIEFGARAIAASDGNSTKALKAAFDDLADKKGFIASIDALNNLHFAHADGVDFSVQKSTSSYKGVIVSGHSTMDDGASRILALRTADSKVVLQGSSDSNVKGVVLADLASKFRALDETARSGFKLAEITDANGATVSLQFYRIDDIDFTAQSTSDDLTHDGGTNASPAQFLPTIDAEVNIKNKAGSDGLELGDEVSVALTNGTQSITVNNILVTSAGVVQDIYDAFLAIPEKKGYSFEKNTANDQLTIKRADGENFSVKITPLDKSGDAVDVMRLDLDGGGDNVTTDTDGQYQDTFGGNATNAKVSISAFTNLADNLSENITAGGAVLTTTAVSTNNASALSANQNKTSVTFSSIEGIDTNEGSPNGFSASARTVDYNVRVGSLDVTIGAEDVVGSNGSDVARAAIDALRTNAPIPAVTGLISKKSEISFTLSDINLSASQIHNAVTKVVNHEGANYTFVSDGTNISVSGGPENLISLSFAGSTVSGFAKSPPVDGEKVHIKFENQEYTLTMVNGEVVVSGGERDRLNAYYDSDMKLRISSKTGSLSKSSFTIVPDAEVFGNFQAARDFGLMDGFVTPITYFSNQPSIDFNFKSGGTVAEGGETIQVDLVSASGAENLTFTTTALAAGDDNEIIEKVKAAFDALADAKGYSASLSDNILSFTRFDGDNFSFEVTESGTVGSTAISFEANLRPASKADLTSGVATSFTTIGSPYNATDFELFLEGNTVTANSSGDVLAPEFMVEAKSLAGQRLTLTGLPDEELIIAIGDSGARRISMQYDVVPDNTPSVMQEITVKILDASAGTVEFFDKATGTSIASRTLDDDNSTKAMSFNVEFEGILKSGDSFHLDSNLTGVGDSRAMQELVSLRTAEDRADGRGGFQRLFSNTVSQLGATVQSGKMSAEASAAISDASAEAEASYTGVNLDAEASNLIQQQQAYQASARILQTARELFDTLLQSI